MNTKMKIVCACVCVDHNTYLMHTTYYTQSQRKGRERHSKSISVIIQLWKWFKVKIFAIQQNNTKQKNEQKRKQKQKNTLQHYIYKHYKTTPYLHKDGKEN